MSLLGPGLPPRQSAEAALEGLRAGLLRHRWLSPREGCGNSPRGAKSDCSCSPCVGLGRAAAAALVWEAHSRLVAPVE